MNFIKDSKSLIVEDIMTTFDNLITGNDTTTYEEASSLMKKFKVEKIPLIDDNQNIIGLYTAKDILYYQNDMKYSNLDHSYQLRCGAAIGINQDYLDRAEKLIDSDVDVLVIDIANGHTLQCKEELDKIIKIIKNKNK